MAKAKWGTKRTCLSCGKKFYDMRRDPIVCPGCDTPFELNTSTRSRHQRSTADAAPPATETEEKSEPAAGDGDMAAIEDEDTDSDVGLNEEAAETIEDPVELGEDDDDIAEVIEGMEEPDKAKV